MINKKDTEIGGGTARLSMETDMDEIIRCRDCKHFELDHWEKANGIPLIVAHEICMKWGDGCKTSPDGFCFMAEKKEESQ